MRAGPMVCLNLLFSVHCCLLSRDIFWLVSILVPALVTYYGQVCKKYKGENAEEIEKCG